MLRLAMYNIIYSDIIVCQDNTTIDDEQYSFLKKKIYWPNMFLYKAKSIILGEQRTGSE